MDFGNVDTKRWFLGTGLFVAVLFAWIDPEGSAPGHFAERLLLWLLNVFMALGILITVQERLNHSTSLAKSRPWLALTISGIVASLIFSPFALALDVLFGENVLGDGGESGLVAAWLDELTGVVGTTTLVWLGMNAPAILGLDFDGKPAPAKRRSARPADAVETPASAVEPPLPSAPPEVKVAPPPDDAGNALLDLLPDHIGRDIAWMKSELHYLRVVTDRGKALVLFNLRDAAELMPAEEGVMPHRSYWVACRHVERLVSSDGRTELIMTDGKRIPVARRRRAEVRRQVGL